MLLCVLQLPAQLLFAQAPDRPQAPKTAPDEPKKEVVVPTHADESGPVQPASGPKILYLLAGTCVAVVVGVGRLLKRFYSFLGLGVVVNPWTGIFLTLVAVSAAGSHLMLWQVVQNSMGSVSGGRWQGLLTLAGSVLGNVSSVVGRLSRKSRPGSEAASQVKDLEQLKSDNLLIKFISRRVCTGMNLEIDRMARRYDWNVIKPTVSRLLQNERALEPSGASEEAEKYVLAFEPSPDVRTDTENKYRALQRAVGVTSFLELRARLARAAEVA